MTSSSLNAWNFITTQSKCSYLSFSRCLRTSATTAYDKLTELPVNVIKVLLATGKRFVGAVNGMFRFMTSLRIELLSHLVICAWSSHISLDFSMRSLLRSYVHGITNLRGRACDRKYHLWYFDGFQWTGWGFFHPQNFFTEEISRGCWQDATSMHEDRTPWDHALWATWTNTAASGYLRTFMRICLGVTHTLESSQHIKQPLFKKRIRGQFGGQESASLMLAPLRLVVSNVKYQNSHMKYSVTVLKAWPVRKNPGNCFVVVFCKPRPTMFAVI